MRRKIFRQRRSAASREFLFHHSPIAIRYSPPFRHSLPFPDLPICRFHDLPIRFGSAGASPSHSESVFGAFLSLPLSGASYHSLNSLRLRPSKSSSPVEGSSLISHCSIVRAPMMASNRCPSASPNSATGTASVKNGKPSIFLHQADFCGFQFPVHPKQR